ncbi:GNAT family N-acetyltransferase [Hymenobacter chitinivorans]|uniref:RimJ/RimL family protein N-acetyltransferase n=1 Tax=Hymenobacter chitinivorans DSM 11115 TaxID=1121954 RepID=A0A2M9BTH8_9BACT|nr:GNAT family protein [Hymenobacter chitinivorans]PJJ61247.1 RimJ/RimL family protein N-acetyltransferase [Hymenobacter chitinivorans DSM 11115]
MIRLEQFTQADFKQLIEWIKDEELLMNWSGSLFSFPLTEESLAWYIEDTNDPLTSDAFVYKAVDEATGEVVGHISLGGISRKNRSARISRVLVGSTAHRGRGLCQEMIKAVLKIGFEQLDLHRIDLGVYDFNQGAIGCYTKAGMTLEGTSRESLYFNGSYWSLTEMSMLEAEWEKLYGRHKALQAV